jgi:hypothetical protein
MIRSFPAAVFRTEEIGNPSVLTIFLHITIFVLKTRPFIRKMNGFVSELNEINAIVSEDQLK